VILVDGYNLIGQEAGTLSGPSLEKEREKLIRKLEQLSAVSGKRFLVVFDGASRAAENSSARILNAKSPVSVAFSQASQTADGWILKHLSRRLKRSVILVTGDRELAQKAQRLGFKVEPNLNRLETRVQPYLTPSGTEAQEGGDLLSSISRQSREALAQARKKAKNL